MGDPFLSEIRIMTFNFAPQGHATCDGQFLPINQNQALFSLLGTTYGGNGQTTFALPNLRGRVPLHFGATFSLGEQGGESSHTVTTSELPTHTHFVQATSANATTNTAGNTVTYARAGVAAYAGPPANTTMLSTSVSNVGGSQPHENMQPYLVLNFCIALQGIFPSQN